MLIDDAHNFVHAEYKMSIISNKSLESSEKKSKKSVMFFSGKDWGFKKFIKRDVLFDKSNGLLPNDKLTVFCQINVSGISNHTSSTDGKHCHSGQGN